MKLEVSKFSKKFGDKVIFDNLTYTFDDFGLYVVVGESGIGKTTLLRAIAGIDSDYSDSITGGGIKNTSFMFQEYRLFPNLTALQNAAISSDSSMNTAKQLLSILGFTEDDLKKKPAELSGGMKQRVAFVRALLKSSPILILDEPTKELDSDMSETMLSMINDEAKKRLVIVVTHDNIFERADNSHVIRL